MTNAISVLFIRDLNRLANEISSFQDETNMWKTTAGILNPAGTLALHITGNLQHFIGAILGGSGYVRDREHEFSARDVPAADILAEIEQTKETVVSALSQLEPGTMHATYPIDILESNATTEQIILHLYGHLNWHLGQVNYLRRILEA